MNDSKFPTVGGEEQVELHAVEEEAQEAQPADHKVGMAYADLPAMRAALEAIEPLDTRGRRRVVKWLVEVLGVDVGPGKHVTAEVTESAAMSGASSVVNSSGSGEISPREFISQKKPNSLVERVACLAYYLTRHRGNAYFKTADIVDLNTEAAARRFGNPSRDVDNADRQSGYIVSAGNGNKQLTVRGEAVVVALPDRDAVKAALNEHPYKVRRARESSGKKQTGREGVNGE